MKNPFKERFCWEVSYLIEACAEDLQRHPKIAECCADELRGMLRAVSIVIPHDKQDLYLTTKAEVFAYLRGLVPEEVAETFFYLQAAQLQKMRSASQEANDRFYSERIEERSARA